MVRIRDSISGVIIDIPYTTTKAKRILIENALSDIQFHLFNKKVIDIFSPLFDVHTVYRYDYASQYFEFRRVRYNNVPITIEYSFEGNICLHYVVVLNRMITLVPVSWFI